MRSSDFLLVPVGSSWFLLGSCWFLLASCRIPVETCSFFFFSHGSYEFLLAPVDFLLVSVLPVGFCRFSLGVLTFCSLVVLFLACSFLLLPVDICCFPWLVLVSSWAPAGSCCFLMVSSWVPAGSCCFLLGSCCFRVGLCWFLSASSWCCHVPTCLCESLSFAAIAAI